MTPGPLPQWSQLIEIQTGDGHRSVSWLVLLRMKHWISDCPTHWGSSFFTVDFSLLKRWLIWNKDFFFFSAAYFTGFYGICCFETWSNNSSCNKRLLSLSLWIPHQGLGENSTLFLPYSEVPRPLRPLRWEGQSLCVSGTEALRCFSQKLPSRGQEIPQHLNFLSLAHWRQRKHWQQLQSCIC